VATASAPSVASESPRVQMDAGEPPPSHEDVASATAPRPTFPVRPTGHSPPGPGLAPTVAPTAPPASAPQPTTTSHIRQQIDTSNPYGH
jgi:hypothetical protein